jgi:hypothetical protein
MTEATTPELIFCRSCAAIPSQAYEDDDVLAFRRVRRTGP